MRELTPEEIEITQTWEQKSIKVEPFADGSGMLVFTYVKEGHDDVQIRFAVGRVFTPEELAADPKIFAKPPKTPTIAQHSQLTPDHKNN